MGKAYSPGLAVTSSTIVRMERILPLKGDVLVKVGDKVKAEDVVARALLPGKVVPLNMANKLGTTANLVGQYMKVQPGDQITEGQLLAETPGFLGMFKTHVKSPTTGEVESISKVTGQVLLREPRVPVEVKAFIDGIVVEVRPDEGVVVENKSAYVQGIFGVGGERLGKLSVLINDPTEELKADKINDSHKGMIIVSGSMITYEAIEKAMKCGVIAIITGGINDQAITKLLGYDLGVAITGHEKIPLSIVVTEGFGNINMARKTYDLLKKFDGSRTSIHGKTQIRAGVMRPEIIIPLEFNEKELVKPAPRIPILEPGCVIRVIRNPNFGMIGKATGMPEELHVVESETKVRILQAELENGQKVVLPRANVEIIED